MKPFSQNSLFITQEDEVLHLSCLKGEFLKVGDVKSIIQYLQDFLDNQSMSTLQIGFLIWFKVFSVIIYSPTVKVFRGIKGNDFYPIPWYSPEVIKLLVDKNYIYLDVSTEDNAIALTQKGRDFLKI